MKTLRWILRRAVATAIAAQLGCGGAPARHLSVTLSSSAPSPQPAGAALVFTADAGASDDQYQFWLQAGAIAAPALARDWSASGSFTLSASTPPGDYVVIVHARDAAADAEADASTDLVLLPPAAPSPPPSPSPSPAPILTAVTPRFGPVAGGTTVTITGAGFQPGVSVVFGPFPQTVVSVTHTAITLVTVPGLIGGCKNCTGLVDVLVQNPDLQQARIAGGFTFTP